MTTSPANRPPFTVADAQRVASLIDSVDLKLATALNEIRLLCQERDLLSVWNDEDGWFSTSFEPIADHFHTLQRAHLELVGGQEAREHQLTELVDLQRDS